MGSDTTARESSRRYTGIMSGEELRSWIRVRREAASRERSEWRNACGPPEEAIHQALSLIELWARLHGWPAPEDVVTRREDEIMYERWRRLRARLQP